MNHKLIENVIEFLRTDPGVAALVAARIFKKRAKRSDVLPYVIVNQIGEPDTTFTNQGDLRRYQLQISSFGSGETPDIVASNIDAAVFSRMSRARRTNFEPPILSARSITAVEIEEPEKSPLGEIVFQLAREYEIETVIERTN